MSTAAATSAEVNLPRGRPGRSWTSGVSATKPRIPVDGQMSRLGARRAYWYVVVHLGKGSLIVPISGSLIVV